MQDCPLDFHAPKESHPACTCWPHLSDPRRILHAAVFAVVVRTEQRTRSVEAQVLDRLLWRNQSVAEGFGDLRFFGGMGFH